jgi:hypothetical protein
MLPPKQWLLSNHSNENDVKASLVQSTVVKLPYAIGRSLIEIYPVLRLENVSLSSSPILPRSERILQICH